MGAGGPCGRKGAALGRAAGRGAEAARLGLSGDAASVDVVSARVARIEPCENSIGVRVP